MDQNLPYITSDLEGIGGCLKAQPAHFCVEEIPLYEPEGQGHHIYFQITREGLTTRSIIESLMRLFCVYETDIGVAGLKDKQAKATQVFSVYLENMDAREAIQKIKGELGLQVNWAKRHKNKLRKGHLLGNSFKILLTDVGFTSFDRASKIAKALKIRGVPNFYGLQRFGDKGNNPEKGRALLKGEIRCQRWLKNLLISSYTSYLFNQWLAQRIERGDWERIYVGDIAKKVKTGGLFTVENVEDDQKRLESQEITYTGPIYGWKMKMAEGVAGQWERRLLEQESLTDEIFKNNRLEGSRRSGRIYLSYLSVQKHLEGLSFELTLPKGSYATVIMREFMKDGLLASEGSEGTGE